MANPDNPHLLFCGKYLICDEVPGTPKYDHANLTDRRESSERADLGLDLEQLEDRLELMIEKPRGDLSMPHPPA
jgi:hypothetical protein